MGDVIHTLPAVNDAANAIKGISFDWVIEENFQEIPRWHPSVNQVIPIALRRWRKKLFSSSTIAEFKKFTSKLRQNKYDLIIDAQGLIKSASISCLARGQVVGPDFTSVRDPFAAFFYRKTFKIGKVKDLHAVFRSRQLFSKALNYSLTEVMPNYGVNKKLFTILAEKKFLIFFHGTTWETKHWPETYWMELARLAVKNGYKVKLPWGNHEEYARAKRIAEFSHAIEVLPKLNLKGICNLLANASGVVAVDTGLCHLAAALDVPTVSLYGPTNPELTGAIGRSQKLLKTPFACSPCFNRHCSYAGAEFYDVQPCFSTLPPTRVWDELQLLMQTSVNQLMASEV